MRQWFGWLLLLMCGGLAFAQTPANTPRRLMIGDTRDTITAVFGKPDSILLIENKVGGAVLNYGAMSIEFDRYRAIQWKNFPVAPRKGNYSPLLLGATREEVIAAWDEPVAAKLEGDLDANGNPVGLERWTYLHSTLLFKNKRLAGWENLDTLPLKLNQMLMAQPTTICLGMTVESLEKAPPGQPTVLAPLDAQGNGKWKFGSATLYFHNGKVIGWMDFKKELPFGDTPAALVKSTLTLGSTAADIVAALGTPPAIVPKGSWSATWFYPTQVLNVDKHDSVTELATDRLRKSMTTNPPTAERWPEFVNRMMEQSHLDYTGGLPAKCWDADHLFAAYFQSFGDKGDGSEFAKFKAQNSKSISNSMSKGSLRNERLYFKQGVSFALSCRDSQQLQETMTRQSGDYARGAMYVYNTYMNYLRPVVRQYAITSLTYLPDVTGKTPDAASAQLAQSGLAVDVVRYSDPTVKGQVTGMYPSAGVYLKKEKDTLVVLYTAVE